MSGGHEHIGLRRAFEAACLDPREIAEESARDCAKCRKDIEAARAECATLREAVGAWAVEGTASVPAVERLRRIRTGASEKREVERARPARRRTEGQLRVYASRSRRGAYAAAAALAAACLCFAAILAYRHFVPGRGPEAGMSRDIGRPLAYADPGCRGLFYASATDGVWRAAESDENFFASDLVQTSTAGQAELQAFGEHRVRMAPGTVVRIGDNPAKPRVDLWRGEIEVWAAKSALQVGSLGQGGKLRDECLLQPGDHVVLRAAAYTVSTFVLGGHTLISPDGLRVLQTTLVNLGKPAPKPEPDEEELKPLSAGAENLTREITCRFEKQPLRDAVEELGRAMDIRMRLSPKAEEKFGAAEVTLEVKETKGVLAVSGLAGEFKLEVRIEEGDLVLGVPGEKDAARPRDDF